MHGDHNFVMMATPASYNNKPKGKKKILASCDKCKR